MKAADAELGHKLRVRVRFSNHDDRAIV
jgi:hypothetical protein